LIEMIIYMYLILVTVFIKLLLILLFQFLAGAVSSGFVDGYGSSARFAHSWAMCLENEENILVADFNNHAVRRICIKNGHVETVAYGTNTPTPVSGIKAIFLNPCGVAVEADGNILVADKGNHAIKRIDLKNQTVHTVSGDKSQGKGGDSKDGHALEATWNGPTAVAVYRGAIYVADQYNRKIRKIEDDIVTTVAGSSESVNLGHRDGYGSEAVFSGPAFIIIDSDGNILVSDLTNHRIRKVILNLKPIFQLNHDIFTNRYGRAIIISSREFYLSSEILSTRCPTINLTLLK